MSVESVLKLNGRCPLDSKGHNYKDKLNFLSFPEAQQLLAKGDGLSSFACFVGDEASDEQRKCLEKFVNVSCFEDEVKENNVPKIDINNNEDAGQYTFFLCKTMWLLPGIKPPNGLEDFNPKLLCKYSYGKQCQPDSCTAWKPGIDFEPEDDTTFRITKNIIPYIFDITVQFKVSSVKKELLPTFTEMAGVPIHKAILMERTKRNKQVVDSTAKAKSLLLLHQLEHGVLVTHFTVVINSTVPKTVADTVNSFHKMAAQEVGITATRSRTYWAKRKKKKEKKAKRKKG